MFSLGRSEFTEDKLCITEGLTDVGIIRANAEAGEIARTESSGNGLKAIVAAAGAFGAVADLTEFEVKIITDDEEIAGSEFVKMDEFLDGAPGFVVEILGLDEKIIAGFGPESAKFGFLPAGFMNFGVQIEGQKANVVTGEIIFCARVAETDEKFHDKNCE